MTGTGSHVAFDESDLRRLGGRGAFQRGVQLLADGHVEPLRPEFWDHVRPGATIPLMEGARIVGHVHVGRTEETREQQSVTMVADVLAQIGRSGGFAVKLAANADDLHLEVTAVGRVDFPVSKSRALALCRVAKPARHGLKDQTVLDTTVRDTWEIAKSKIKIDHRTWAKALSSALERIGRDLGLGPEAGLRASLHNMLVYAPGQFFVPHQDSEKSDDMIGTLVVTLPSEFSGGEIVVQHHEEKVTFRGSGKGLDLIAFYADCHHEVRPVKSGYRIVLTYNLLLAKDRDATLTVCPEQLDALEADVRAFFLTAAPARWPGSAPPEPPERLVYLLDHQYSQKGLGWMRLKNADAARAAALREVARRLDCTTATPRRGRPKRRRSSST